MNRGAVQAWIAASSDLEPLANLARGLAELRARFPDLVHSRAYANAPRGGIGAEYVNLAAGFTTDLDPAALARVLREIEASCGRRRSPHTGAPGAARCPLDLDLLLLGGTVGRFDGVALPHPDVLKRSYVLGPLAEIAPHVVHPTADRPLAELWATFDRSAHPLRAVALPEPPLPQ